MADAIIKISWRRLPNGIVAPQQAIGGIAGTCFTLTSGITLSCAHGHHSDFFQPHPTFDDYRILIIETAGKITEVRQQQFRLFPDYDAAIIDSFQSSTKYSVSSKKYEELQKCNLLGYVANIGPFKVRIDPSGRGLEIYEPHIFDARQYLDELTPVPTVINMLAPDVSLSNKAGYIIDVKAKIGLSGGPMVDASDGGAVGVCSFGLPADVMDKTQIGVVDLRQFPFI